ncbi:MAG TPA: cytochrome ubiquinol oxidase subunit I [Polyangia bacterium]|nr:cytochrome ubiquinol oxidase subunit I [Polyangia bacterium]
MDGLGYARAQMGLSLAFHIVFAAVGVALPLLLVMAELRWRRTRDEDYLELAKRLGKGTGILFAVGAVSGTVLSFELGLLWPRFMGTFGEAIGLPFALEGFAFFTEAIFLGIYLYGRGRVSERLHLFSALAVAVSGALSAFFVTLVNAFMNNPAGIVETSRSAALELEPLRAMWSPSWPYQTVHVLLASYQATAWAMVGIHAFFLLRDPRRALHRKALGIALPLACVAALVQPLSGDRSAKHVALAQPVKLAAAEGLARTTRAAPLRLGGWPDPATGEIRGALSIPGGLSFLAHGDPQAMVIGLDQTPPADRPPVVATREAFQVMVGSGTAMAGVAALAGACALRRRRRRARGEEAPWPRGLLVALVAASPLGFVALEAGWLVTEWGRQPWVVRGYLRTAEAVTSFPYKAAPFWLFTVVYLFLGAAVAYLLGKQIVAAHRAAGGARGH